MTYREQLLHPNWQRRRLEVLSAAGFACVRCGNADRQLHAHHKVYIKGRMAWEYPDELLECLCDPCHALAHEQKERLDLQLAQFPSSALPAITRAMRRLSEAIAAGNNAARVDALNALQDEIDAAEDFARGDGSERPVALRCICAELRSKLSKEKWEDQAFYENGHVSDCPVGESMNVLEA